MSDLIDRQAAIDEIKEPMMLEYVWAYSCKEEEEAISVLVETICQQTKSIIGDRLERLQSADVVEVVRCKDCENYQTDWQPLSFDDGHYCAMVDTTMPYDGFCHMGERRGE